MRLPEPGFSPSTPSLGRAVLVHGLFRRGRMFRKMVRALEEQGVSCELPDLRPANAQKGIEPLAEQLHQTIRQDASPTALIGFSMGALIIRYYLQHYAGDRHFPLYISIAGPHRGSLWSYLAPGKGAAEMRLNSEFIRQLSPPTQLPVKRIVSYRTPLDQAILPSSSAKLEGADNHLRWVFGHETMAFSRGMIRAVQAEVLTAFRAPTSFQKSGAKRFDPRRYLTTTGTGGMASQLLNARDVSIRKFEPSV